jgi:phosphatidylinositol-3-phosphatase
MFGIRLQGAWRARTMLGILSALTLMAAVSLTARPTEAHADTVTTAAVIADTYTDGTATNHGTSTTVQASHTTFHAYLRADTSAIPAGSTVTSASLVLHPTSSPASGGFTVYPAPGGWTETGLTSSNEPALDTTLLATSGTPVSGSTLTIPLPASSITVGSSTNFRLSYSVSSITAKFASRETATPPSLSITWSSGSPLCGFKTGTATTSKLMVIMEENHDASSVYNSSSAPYIASVQSSCGYVAAGKYQSYTHPSLPNYMTLTSGLTYDTSPWTSDCSPSTSGCNTANASIFSQLGSGWKGYDESMPSNCYKSGSGSYAPRHNPATYYTNIATACSTQDVPSGTYTSGALYTDVQNGTLPAYSMVTPNLANDMHDGTVAAADTWLQNMVGMIAAGPDYQNGNLVIVIAGDEGSGSGTDVVSYPPLLVLSAWTPAGTVSSPTSPWTEYSVLRTAEEVAGLTTFLGGASTATSLRAAFHF